MTTALNIVGKALKTFIPVYYNDNGTTTPLNPKPKVYWGKALEEQAFYVYETLLSNLSQIQNTSRIQILYKHKELKLGMGMIEASEIIRSLKTHLNSIIYNDNCIYVGFHNEFYIYSLNFNVDENK